MITALPARLLALVAAAAAVIAAGLALAAPAAAATATTPNACRYSIDGLWRDMPLEVTTSVSILPDPRYPSPTEVVPGLTVRSATGTFDVDLPDYLARFGYGLGLLKPGPNTVQADVWLAVRATNTKERTRVVGPVTISATTTIDADPSSGDFIGATPWSYSAPVLPQFDWLAVGGDVAISQAGPGTLPVLPVGPGDAPRALTGSAAIQLTFTSSPVVPSPSLYLDCQPGATTGIEFDFSGDGFAPQAPAVAATAAGPQNLLCLNDAGRQRVGLQADFPGGQNRELDPLRAVVSAPGAAATFTPGATWTLPAGRLTTTLSPGTVATLGRFPDGGGALVAPGATYPVSAWVTLAAANTAEGTRTLQVTGSWTPQPAAMPVTSSSPWQAAEIAFDLPPTTWTPTGAGPVVVTLAPPASTAPITVTGPASGGPAGPVAGTTFTASPYGSVVLRLGTGANPAALDCVTGAVAIDDGGIVWSNAGRGAPPAGSAGRYAIDANLDTPAIAVATAASPAPPAPPAQPVVPAPPAPVPLVTPGRLAGSRLLVTRNRVAVTVSCQGRTTACRGVLRIRTAGKVKVGRRKAARITVVAPRRYSVAAGRRAVLRIALTPRARQLMTARRQVRVRVELDPARGRTIARTVPLRRR
ncbi:MAG: hypothetical protein AB7V62_00965 [Thermoleophilia bacterium]